jgi:hypothetical protein
MTISGFTFIRNGGKLFYPVAESIQSILPLVDEFVVALGEGDADDNTLEIIKSIGSPKIRLVNTGWDTIAYPGGTEYAHQTDIAKAECKGDWLFYLQSDEVIHERDHEVIRSACEKYLNDRRVEGFLFHYYHFWGDYEHYLPFHGWYEREIRIVRNDPNIHSFGDAQSFRVIEGFDGKSYRKKEGTRKLNVILLPAHVYHYGWVRPPHVMDRKGKLMHSYYHGGEAPTEAAFDYGPMKRIPKVKGRHPAVMTRRIAQFGWASSLNYDRDQKPDRSPMKHERLKYRIITLIERILFGGRQALGYSNWNIIGKYPK